MKKAIFTLMMLALVATGAMAQQHSRHPEGGRPEDTHRVEGGRQEDSRRTEQYAYAATPRQVALIMDHLRSLTFDSDRKKAAVLCVSLCPMAVRDLLPIIDLFSFDDSKVEVLRAAFLLCPDKHHYYRAIEKLTFQSSKDSMYDYMDSVEF